MKDYFDKYKVPLIIGFGVGVVLVLLIFYTGFVNSVSDVLGGSPITADSRLDNGKYKFIKPILNSGYGNEDETLKWFPAERQLKTLVQDIISERSDIKTGVFFLNLNNSGWFSVNASDTFIPASLLKLPMLSLITSFMRQRKIYLNKRLDTKVRILTPCKISVTVPLFRERPIP